MFAAKSLPNLVTPAGRGNAFHEPVPITPSLSNTQKFWARFLPLPHKPRVPLLSGSVLVLLTLFLPVAYSQCGSARWTGSDYLLGFGTWPGSLGALSYALGRVPYFFTLLLAAVTLFLVLAVQIRPSLLHKPGLTASLFVTAGTLSLFMIGDFFGFQLGSRIDVLLTSRLTASGQNLFMMILAASILAVTVICLRSRLLRSRRWIVWLFTIAGGISVFAIVNFSLALFASPPIIPSDWAFFLTITPSVLYFVIPIGLWRHFGLTRQEGLQAQWPGIRRRIALLYLPAAIFDLVALSLEIRPGRLSGLLPYFAGLGLIFWGYAGVEKRVSLMGESVGAGGSEDAVKHASIHAA